MTSSISVLADVPFAPRACATNNARRNHRLSPPPPAGRISTRHPGRGANVIATLPRLLLLLSFLTIAGCATTRADHTYNAVSLSGKIVLPILGNEDTLWIDDGPMIVTSRNPDISYRAIDKAEIAFAGSKKSAFDFFHAVFENPMKIAEKSLAESLSSHEYRREARNGLVFHSVSDQNETIVYILSPKLDIVVEARIGSSDSKEIVATIVESTHLTK